MMFIWIILFAFEIVYYFFFFELSPFRRFQDIVFEMLFNQIKYFIKIYIKDINNGKKFENNIVTIDTKLHIIVTYTYICSLWIWYSEKRLKFI